VLNAAVNRTGPGRQDVPLEIALRPGPVAERKLVDLAGNDLQFLKHPRLKHELRREEHAPEAVAAFVFFEDDFGFCARHLDAAGPLVGNPVPVGIEFEPAVFDEILPGFVPGEGGEGDCGEAEHCRRFDRLEGEHRLNFLLITMSSGTT